MSILAITSEADLAEAVRAAIADVRTLEIRGAGSKSGFGVPIACNDVLDLSGLRGIVSYEPEELILTARAGTPLAEIEAAIAAKHQRLGFEPADWGALYGGPAGASTIAGALAADTSGAARIRFGSARDSLLGFRAVNGHGEAYKAGGKVVKNVTGFDLPKLMCGALGTLGPMSEVSLRLHPYPERFFTLAVRDLQPEEGLALLRQIWAMPLEASGLLFIPACAAGIFPMYGGIGAGAALIRLEGSAEVLAEKRTMLQALLDGRDTVEVPQGEEVFAQAASGAGFSDPAIHVWRLAVPPARAADTAHALAGTLWYADWAGGLIWVGTSGAEDASASSLRHIAARAGGHATLLRAPAEIRTRVPVFPPQGETLAALTRGVRGAFDPQGLFNPGRMG